MRLIDADAVLHEISTDAWDNHPLRYTEQEARNLIEQAPTIDPRDWTPCAEGLPDAFDGEPKDAPWYLCSKNNGTRCILVYQKCGTVDDWRTITGLGTSDSVVAYIKLPSHYRADDTTGKVKEEAE